MDNIDELIDNYKDACYSMAWNGESFDANKAEPARSALRAEFERQAARITELEQASQWIPVTERLPEPRTPVLIITDYVMSEVCYLSPNGCWTDVMRPQHTTGSVTHWMPLSPPPPQG